jgi:hypothetical protein
VDTLEVDFLGVYCPITEPLIRRSFGDRWFDLVRSGRTPEEVAREFEPTAQSISTRVKQAERDAIKRPIWLGPTGSRLLIRAPS